MKYSELIEKARKELKNKTCPCGETLGIDTVDIEENRVLVSCDYLDNTKKDHYRGYLYF